MTFPPRLSTFFYKYYTSAKRARHKNTRPDKPDGTKMRFLPYKTILFKALYDLGVGHILPCRQSFFNLGKAKCSES